MNILLIGSGGREHALAWALSGSKSTESLFIAPGNAGTMLAGKNVDLNIEDFNEVRNFCKSNSIELVVIGPEKPLVDGMSDFLRSYDIKVFGPSQKAALIEGDKAFAKNLMSKYKIPTANFKTFERNEKEELIEYLSKVDYPIVIKASGLAAGKGVSICEDFKTAKESVINIFEKNVFGEAGDKCVVEEFLKGQEASVFAITDGREYVLLPPSQDHKRIFDGDKGPNTGGMGAYAPTPFVTPGVITRVENEIIRPILSALLKETGGFKGCLYAGLMITNDGPKVVEFNCRFGDPETQAVLPLVEGDLAELFLSAASGQLNKRSISFIEGTAVCVVAASEGYPLKYRKGFEITGLEQAEKEAMVFHAGTALSNGKIVTNGGRVLGVTSVVKSNNLLEAKNKAYEALSKIHFSNIYYRKDIADKAIKY